MASFAGPNITNNNLAFNLDAGNVKSYPGSGATWNDFTTNLALFWERFWNQVGAQILNSESYTQRIIFF